MKDPYIDLQQAERRKTDAENSVADARKRIDAFGLAFRVAMCCTKRYSDRRESATIAAK